MITNIEGTSQIQELNRINLDDYWNEYFDFRDRGIELHQITEELMQNAIESVRNSARPFIDSQQIINKILTDLGKQHIFHRQFAEQFPDYHANQILGMQLYRLMVYDEDTWVYFETQHSGHMFSHATYFIPET
ncbi:hypothetical protein ACFL4T_06530 [candidate division KSB1 bacterium]